MTPQQEAIAHFNNKTGGTKESQHINFADMWLYKNGYRIDHAGGIIPERYWVKEDERINVRNYEVQYSNRIPQSEKDLLQLIYPKKP